MVRDPKEPGFSLCIQQERVRAYRRWLPTSTWLPTRFLTTHIFTRQQASRDKAFILQGKIHGFHITMLNQGWFNHPSADVDLCATPIEPLRREAERLGKRIFFTTLSTAHVPDEQVLSELLALEPVTMIGYPIGLWDEVNKSTNRAPRNDGFSSPGRFQSKTDRTCRHCCFPWIIRLASVDS
jgi:hypothetical protein